MPEIVKNKLHIKRVPLNELPFPQDVLVKLYKGRDRELKGQNIDYRTPLFATKAGEATFVPKMSRISGVNGLVPPVRHTLVEKFFQDVISKSIKNHDYLEGEKKFMQYRFSSRSVKLPFDMIYESTILPYFQNAVKSLDAAAQEAIEKGLTDGVRKLDVSIPPRSLRPLSYEQATDALPATTNWGAPYFLQGKVMDGQKVVEDNRKKYLDMARELAEAPESEKNITRNAFGSIGRGQESNDHQDKWEGLVKPKQRRPGAEGHGGTIIGARMKPFLDKRAESPTRAALVNQRKVDEVISSYGPFVKDNKWMVSGDGSSFDTHMMPGLAMKIGDAIIDRFNCSEVDRESFKRYFHHVFNDPLITPSGLMGAPHGMPSGTTFTNELDSCYNEVLVEAFKYLPTTVTRGRKVSLQTVTDQGDDLVLIFEVLDDQEITEEEIRGILSDGYAAMNMSVNPKKQMVSQHKCEYLKRLHTRGITESYRSYVWTLIGMLNMEHSKDGKSAMYSSRGIMQASNHYASLEGFNSFMSGIASGDKVHHLGIGTKGGAMRILQMAGGEESVIKRLGYAAYTTHLGVDVNKSGAKIADLSAASGVAAQNSMNRADINDATRKTERGHK